MDVVFDRTAEGRLIESLTVVDDATHEAVAVALERAIGGYSLTRIIESWRREYNEERTKESAWCINPRLCRATGLKNRYIDSGL